MGFNDHIDFELSEMIDEAVDEGLLDENSAGYGIARQAAEQGLDTLSAKQRAVLDNIVWPAMKRLDRFKPRQ